MMVGSVDAGMGGMGGMGDMGGMPGGMEQEGFIMSMFHKLPMWGQGLLTAILVIALAWIAGIIIGKLYASVKYPDPEKPSLINPLLKIGLGAAVVVCGFWIYYSFTKPDVQKMPVDNPNGIVDESSLDGDMPEGNIPEGEIPEGEVPEGEVPENEASENEAANKEENKETAYEENQDKEAVKTETPANAPEKAANASAEAAVSSNPAS